MIDAIESFLGIITLCIILICCPLSLIQYVSIKLGIKQHEDGISYIGDYVLSLITFLMIATFSLLFYIYIYFKLVDDSPGFNSGINFLILGLFSGLIIKLFYILVMKIILHFDKSKTTYFLKNHEIIWSLIFICLIFFLYFIFNNEMTIALSYLSIIISYFFWIDFSKESLFKKIEEIKLLSNYYLCFLYFMIFCIFASTIYQRGVDILASLIGMVLGFVIAFFCMNHINSKFKPKFSSSNDSSK